MFKYNYLSDFKNRLKNSNGLSPLQIELHPGSHCFGLNCSFCYGSGLNLCEGSLTLADYRDLLDSLRHPGALIELSGIKSDPMSYTQIEELVEMIIDKGFVVGIHTKGINISDKLVSILSNAKEGSFVTISVDAGDAKTYADIHDCHSLEMFEKVCSSLEKLSCCSARKEMLLQLNVSCLLFKSNSSPIQLDQMIKRFEAVSDVLKFSLPHVPHSGVAKNYLSSDEYQKIGQYISDNFDSERVIVLPFSDSKHVKFSGECHSARFNLVIDHAGNVYPCSQTALRQYDDLSFGNIHDRNIMQLWSSKERGMVLNTIADFEKCMVCGRRDEIINELFKTK